MKAQKHSRAEWYAYIHVNGTLHPKRFMGDYGDIDETRESDFVMKVFDPFFADSRQDAINKIEPEAMAFLKSYQEM